MDKFQEMQTFCTVVDEGSFASAADHLHTSRAAVSRHVNALETRLDARLLHRTTRRLSLTEEGALFYNRCRELLASLEEAESELGQRTGTARGLLRINIPVTYGIKHLADLWGNFLALHPQVRLDITLADRVVDLVEEGYDLAIRIARLPSSTLISRKLASTRIVLCASPEYLNAQGIPEHPSDLRHHAVIGYSYWSGGDEWFFDGPEGRVGVKTDPCIRSNSGETCRAAALAHQGIILQPEFLVGSDLTSGALIELIPQYRSLELGIYAVYPSRKHVPPKVRALIDFLVAELTKGDGK